MNFTYKQKVWMLLGGTLVFLLIAWWLSFGKTYQAYQEKWAMQAQIEQAANVPQEVAMLRKKLQDYEQDSMSMGFSQERLYEVVTDWCEQHGVIVQAMPEAELVEQDGYEVYMNRIALEGNFVDLLQLTYLLERKYKLGQIVHSDFELRKNRETRQMELIANLHLHNIQSKKNETN